MEAKQAIELNSAERLSCLGCRIISSILYELPAPVSEIEQALMPLVEAGKITLPPLQGKIKPVSESELPG